MRNAITILIVCVFTQANAQYDTTSNLSDVEKIKGLSLFWSEAKYNFAFFDKTNINWDSAYYEYIPKVLQSKNTWAYYDTMKKFCALLKDGHTGIFPPDASLIKASRYRYIHIENFNHHLYVTNLPIQFKNEVPLGSEVIKINGMPVKQYLEQYSFPYISASTDHQLWNDAARNMFYGNDTNQHWDLELKTPQGKTVQHISRFHTMPALWVLTESQFKLFDFRKEGDVGIVTINSFQDQKVVEEFKKILPQLYTCKGIIIDIRKNGGGNTGIGAEILKYFTSKPRLVGSTWRTREHLSAFDAWGQFYIKQNYDSLDDFGKKAYLTAKGNYWFKGDTMTFDNNIKDKRLICPLIVLFGNYTASAAEDFLVILDDLKGRAITIGQRSYGSTGQPLFFSLPGGGAARVCTKRDTYPDGREFVGYGIKPDIELSPTVMDVINGKDPVMNEAVRRLK